MRRGNIELHRMPRAEAPPVVHGRRLARNGDILRDADRPSGIAYSVRFGEAGVGVLERGCYAIGIACHGDGTAVYPGTPYAHPQIIQVVCAGFGRGDDAAVDNGVFSAAIR